MRVEPLTSSPACRAIASTRADADAGEIDSLLLAWLGSFFFPPLGSVWPDGLFTPPGSFCLLRRPSHTQLPTRVTTSNGVSPHSLFSSHLCANRSPLSFLANGFNFPGPARSASSEGDSRILYVGVARRCAALCRSGWDRLASFAPLPSLPISATIGGTDSSFVVHLLLIRSHTHSTADRLCFALVH